MKKKFILGALFGLAVPVILAAQFVSPVQVKLCAAGQFLNEITSGGIPNCGTPAATTPGGATGGIQYNNGGAFGGVVITGLVDSNGVAAPTAYPGTNCVNQFPRSLNVHGIATCASVANTDLTSSTISGVSLGSNLFSLTNGATLLGSSYNGSAAISDWDIDLGHSNSWTSGQAVTPVVLTPGSTVSVDASLSDNFTLAAAQNFTLNNPSNLKAGQTLNFWITQDATGSRVITTGSQYQAAGGAATLILSTTPNTKDLVTCVSDTTTSLTCGVLKAISH